MIWHTKWFGIRIGRAGSMEGRRLLDQAAAANEYVLSAETIEAIKKGRPSR